MTTYARLVGGVALDCQVAGSTTELAARFHPAWLADNSFTVVPDGTTHGAKDNGNGTFTNPTGSPPTVQARVLPWADLTAYLIGLLGGGTAGRAALGTIIKTCQASSAGADNYFSAYLQSNTSFAKADFISVLADVSTVIIPNGQKTAVANNWPQG